MSDTTTQKPPQEERLITQQGIIALVMMAIVAGTVVGVFRYGNNDTISMATGLVLGYGSAVAGFYFGSSRGSQTKDAALVAQAARPAPPQPAAGPV